MSKAFLLATLLYIFSSSALACSCRSQKADEYYESASNIVIGKIVKLEVVPDAEITTQKVTIENIELLKGKKYSEIYSSLDMASCQGEIFQLNIEHIFFLDKSGWSQGYCGGTMPTQYQQEFVKAIRGISENGL